MLHRQGNAALVEVDVHPNPLTAIHISIFMRICKNIYLYIYMYECI